MQFGRRQRDEKEKKVKRSAGVASQRHKAAKSMLKISDWKDMRSDGSAPQPTLKAKKSRTCFEKKGTKEGTKKRPPVRRR